MADITKCSNKTCVFKERCYRHTAPADPKDQPYVYYEATSGAKEPECIGWLEIREADK